MGRDQLMDRFRPPISGGIKPDRRRRLEQRHRHLPKPLDALGGREQRMVAAHRVEIKQLPFRYAFSDQRAEISGASPEIGDTGSRLSGTVRPSIRAVSANSLLHVTSVPG